MLEIIKVLLLGIVEGISEWLPISSTGHMILFDEFIKLDFSDKFKEMFFVLIQLGAIMAVVLLYFKKLMPLKIDKGVKLEKEKLNLWYKIIIACLPAAIIGIPFDDYINDLFYNHITVSIMLVVYGVLFIIVENRHKDTKPKFETCEDISYKLAFIIGIFQVLSLIPGTSRSGATILGAIIFGASRKTAAEFTFYLAIPVMFGASLIKILKFGFDFTQSELLYMAVGLVSAFVVSIITIKFLISYIKKSDFKVFGWYRIALGIIVILYFSFFK